MDKPEKFSQNTLFLIIDESENFRAAISTQLRTLGFKNLRLSNQTTSVMSLLKGQTVGFIMCEIEMPGMSGVELLKEIRTSFLFPGIPFLMMGSDAKKDDLAEIGEYDIDGFITKPFSFKILAEKVHHAVNHYYDPANVEFQIDQTRRLYLEKKYDEALEALQKLLLQNPKSARIRVAIAKCYQAMKN